jgi:hypothetical protein
VLINGEGRWLTAPVDRGFHGTRAINEMVFSSHEDWRGRVLKTLATAYRKAPCFDESFAVLDPLIRNPLDNVAEYNIHAIRTLAGALGLRTDGFVRSSDFPTEAAGTERLIELTVRVGGDSYLCGGGAAGYQDDSAFEKAHIGLVYQNFTPRRYPQTGCKDFVAGLSIIDALMNCGVSGVRGLLEGQRA